MFTGYIRIPAPDQVEDRPRAGTTTGFVSFYQIPKPAVSVPLFAFRGQPEVEIGHITNGDSGLGLAVKGFEQTQIRGADPEAADAFLEVVEIRANSIRDKRQSGIIFPVSRFEQSQVRCTHPEAADWFFETVDIPSTLAGITPATWLVPGDPVIEERGCVLDALVGIVLIGAHIDDGRSTDAGIEGIHIIPESRHAIQIGRKAGVDGKLILSGIDTGRTRSQAEIVIQGTGNPVIPQGIDKHGIFTNIPIAHGRAKTLDTTIMNRIETIMKLC